MRPSSSQGADNYLKSGVQNIIIIKFIHVKEKFLVLSSMFYYQLKSTENVFLQATFGHQVLEIQQTPGHQYFRPATKGEKGIGSLQVTDNIRTINNKLSTSQRIQMSQ